MRVAIAQALAWSCMGTALILFSLTVVAAQVRTSPSYQIESDSINVGGGFSSSTNFQQESTVGEVATGRGESATYQLRAGYQQMQEVFISLSLSSSSLTLAPALSGLTGGQSAASTTATVVTDSRAGYTLSIASESSPAMQKGVDSIQDYSPVVPGTPDYNFIIGATDALFGFSPEGSDVVSRFLDNGVDTCGVVGGDTSLRCWDGLSTSALEIARGAGANHPEGTATTVQFRVGIGGTANVVPGFYVATTTLTALPL